MAENTTLIASLCFGNLLKVGKNQRQGIGLCRAYSRLHLFIYEFAKIQTSSFFCNELEIFIVSLEKEDQLTFILNK